jgi:O-antigen ligase
MKQLSPELAGSRMDSIRAVSTHIASAALVVAFFALPTSRALLHLSLFIFTLFLIFSGELRKKRALVWATPVAAPFLLLYALVVIGCFYGPGSAAIQRDHLFFYSKFLIGLLLIALLANNPVLQKRALLAFAAAMFLSACISFFKWLGWIPESISKSFGASPGDFAAFKDYLIQNVMMGMLCIVAISVLLDDNKPSRKNLFFACTALFFAIVALFVAVERGRTGQVGLLLGLLLIIGLVLPLKHWFIALVTVTVVAFCLYAANDSWRNHIHLAVNEAINYETQKNSSVGNRLYLYHWAVEQTAQRDWLSQLIGSGTASYSALAQQSFSADSCRVSCPHPHSQFIFYWIEHGILGLATFIFLLFQLIKQATLSNRRSHKILMLGFFGIFFIDSLFHSSLWLRMEGFFSVMMIAVLTTACAGSLRTFRHTH